MTSSNGHFDHAPSSEEDDVIERSRQTDDEHHRRRRRGLWSGTKQSLLSWRDRWYGQMTKPLNDRVSSRLPGWIFTRTGATVLILAIFAVIAFWTIMLVAIID